MANLNETDEYPLAIYQLEQGDPVLGGTPNEATRAGIDNIPHLQLAKRTHWLKTRVDQLVTKVIAATTAIAGIVRLSSATNSTSETEAATPRAVKAAWDNAETRALKSTALNAAGLATGGGTLAADRTITVPAATQAEAEAGALHTVAMTPLRVMQAIAVRLASRTIGAAGLAVGGGTMSADRTITVPAATQAEAEAGTGNSTAMTPVRVMQAITARLAARTIGTAGLASGGGTLAANRTIDVPVATSSEAEAGASNDKAMTPLRVAQAIAARYVSRSLTTNGYQDLPSGLILQWGTGSVDESGNGLVSFPKPFPNFCLNVSITDQATNNTVQHVHHVSLNEKTQQSFRVFCLNNAGNPAPTSFHFFAIGG